MAELAEQQSTEPLPWWIHTCRIGWKVVRYFWATFLVTLVLPKAVEVLFSEKALQSLPNLWPILKVIIEHPIWTLLTFLGLLLLTGLFWFGSRQRITTAQRALTEQDRAYMLKRLQLRYEQMLSQSLQGAVQIELGLVERPAAIQNAASLSLRLPDQPDQPLPDHTSIVDAYDLAQHDLLILGEPGAGKSTLLLELARYLVQQAKQNTSQPLPVLLPLSSWATKPRPLQEWLIEQFAQLYAVPQKLSQQWITTEQLLPLLDGLDEMEATARASCIAAINSYHKEHLQPMVVCSRTNEYEAATRQEKLSLHTGIVVRPLSPAQVDTYLTTLGKPLAALRNALRRNSVLQEIATTPLMLQVLMLTYHDTPVRALSQRQVQLQEQIWADYVQRMVSRKGDAKRYPLTVTTVWLGWLARQMRTHNQTVFFLEQFQPNWLPSRQRVFYQWSVGLLVGLPSGLLSGLLVGLLVGLPSGLTSSLLYGQPDGLTSGLLVGLLFGLLSQQGKIEPAEALAWSWKQVLVGLLFGLLVGLLFGLLVGLLFGLLVGLTSGLLGALLSQQGKIEPAEALAWSWKRLLAGLLVGLLGALFGALTLEQLGWLLFGQFGGQLGALLGWLLFMLLGALLFGLSTKQLTERLTLFPNEGIRRSLKNGLFFGLLGALFFGLLGALLVGVTSGQLAELSSLPLAELSSLPLVERLGALFFGLLVGLFFGLLGALFFGLLGGLRAAIQHYLLRSWLWHTFPLRAVPFLEDATMRILLRRVGGGYSFTHRLLLDYFADLDSHPSSPPSS